MFEYTLDNHFKFGYGGINNFQDRTSSNEPFTAQYGRISRQVQSWRDANLLAAKEIYERKSGDLVLLLSGGMDSEICLKSFTDQDLPIKALTLRFTDIEPTQELKHVERIVNRYKIKHEYVETKFFDLIESSAFEKIGDDLKCVSPVIIAQLWLASQANGTAIIAQGEVHLKKDVPDDYIPGSSPYEPSLWRLVESERLCSIYKYFIQKKRPGIPGFFQYLPEQTHCFLKKNTILNDLISNRIIGKLGTRSSKNAMSLQFYPELEERIKLHGWESVQEIHDRLRHQLGSRYHGHDGYYYKEVSDLLRCLEGLNDDKV